MCRVDEAVCRNLEKAGVLAEKQAGKNPRQKPDKDFGWKNSSTESASSHDVIDLLIDPSLSDKNYLGRNVISFETAVLGGIDASLPRSLFAAPRGLSLHRREVLPEVC